jgi:3-hydroxybutyryl-CoA dehydrogenase
MNAKARIVALGAGRMGRGIALLLAYAGHRCTLIDIKPRDGDALAALRDEAQRDMAATLAGLERIGLLTPSAGATILSRIAFVARDDAPAALRDADLLFEGVPETLEAKRAAFAFAAPHLRDDAIVTSTTSTILADALAAFVARPQRFLNVHFLNPPLLMPLVELSPAQTTAPEIVDQIKALLTAIGKMPVVCAPSPGFIVPRIQTVMMNEAARIVEEGVASAEDVDRAMRYGLGVRYATIGLLEFVDWGGGDVLYHASRYLAETLDDNRYKAPAIVERNMHDGHIGLRSGKGFFDYTGQDPAVLQDDRLKRQVAMLKLLNLLPPPAV